MLDIGRSYEKKSCRWLLELEGIDSFLIKEVDRPTFSPRRFFKPKRSPIRVKIFDTIDPNASKQVFKWVHDERRFRQAAIRLLDPLGGTVERWDLKDAEIMLADFGKLDYASDDPCTINLLIKYRDFECTFGETND